MQYVFFFFFVYLVYESPRKSHVKFSFSCFVWWEIFLWGYFMKLLVGTGSFRLGLTLFCGRYFPWLDFFLCLQVRGWVRVIPKGSIVFGCCLTYIQACTVVYGLCFQNVLASRSPLLDTRKTVIWPHNFLYSPRVVALPVFSMKQVWSLSSIQFTHISSCPVI